MATFVDLASEQDQATILVGFLEKKSQSKVNTQEVVQSKQEKDSSNSEAGAEEESQEPPKSPLQIECSCLAERGEFKALLERLSPLFETVFEGNDTEIEALFSVWFSILRKVPTNQQESLISQILQRITSNKTDRPLLRLRLLNNLYNVFPVSSIYRYNMFRHILSYATESGHSDITLPELSKAEDWLAQWGATTEQSRELYLIISQIYKDHDQTANVFETLQKYLATFDHVEDQSTLDSPSIEVEKVILQAVQLPDVFQLDNLLDLRAVQQFENSSDLRQKKLYKLLQIFANENLKAFQQFTAENSTFLSSVGLNEKACENKMRLLSLMSLASGAEELTFGSIASELDVKEIEVPRWVVSAVSAGLLEAKIDGIRNVVSIERSTQRSFSIGQWQHLATKMRTWKENISQILQILQTTRIGQDVVN